MNRNYISIIIPAFNSENFIAQAIRSALTQGLPNVEVIVIDDGSTDGTADVARKFGEKITLIRQENRGACAARNVGFRTSKGNFIKFLDADDYLLPFGLESEIAHSKSLRPNQFSYGRVMRKIESDGRLVPHSKRDARASNSDSLENLVIDPPVTGAILYPRSLIELLGGFDERLKKRQDFDIFVRAIMAGHKPSAHDAPVFVYRDHSANPRLSRTLNSTIALNQIEMFSRHIDILRSNNCSDTGSLKSGFAETIWVTGRNYARSGLFDEARSLFALASSLNVKHGSSSSMFYMTVSRIFGPISAERICESIKGIVYR